MKQPIKGQGKLKKKKPKNIKKFNPFHIKHKNINQQYGTSKLERDFAKDFLEKNDINFIYQYEAKSIGRWFDFAITSSKRTFVKEEKDGIMSIRQDDPSFELDMLIEIDGSYFHSDPRVVDENKLSPMQKHNKFVDKLKDQYAGMHCVPLVRFWEYDIRKNPKKVLEELEKYIAISDKKRKIIENKKKPH